MKFRNDINGLRAVAVTAVMLFHFGVPGFRGGFVGVDIFFVISGYLMTSIVVSSLGTNSFDLLTFYFNRAKRIIPALSVLCLFLLAAGWNVLFAAEFHTLAKHVISALFFVSNFVFSRESGYFDASPFDKWLLHTWSLSVEWQFYLIYPAVLMGAFKLGGERLLRAAIASIFAVSFALSAFLTKTHPVESFYLLHTRAWELMAGGLVFLFRAKPSLRLALVAETLGLGLIVASISLCSDQNTWPGWMAASPVAGTMLVIWANRAESVITSNPFAQFLGTISYSAYLWHWPVVVYLHYVGLAQSTIAISAGLTGSLALGVASYLAVEKRRWALKALTTKSAWQQTCATLVTPLVILLLAAGVWIADGVPQQIRSVNSSDRLKFVKYYRDLHQHGLDAAYRSECDFYDWETKRSKQSLPVACTEAKGKSSVFIWGDSHAQALSLGLRSILGEHMVSQVATSGCPPSLDGETLSHINNNCRGATMYALEQIERLKPGTVVLAQVDGHVAKDWKALSDRLHTLGVERVVIVGPQPKWDPELPALIARNHWLDKSEYIDDGLHRATIASDAELRKIIKRNGNAEYVSMVDLLCENSACRAFLPGTRDLMAVDSGHLSPKGSLYIAQHAFKGLVPQDALQQHASVP
jgi:peptidoglycan/LPS O-acetylase OafA/YrhL